MKFFAEAAEALIDNSRTYPEDDKSNKKNYKSLADSFKGKRDRLR